MSDDWLTIIAHFRKRRHQRQSVRETVKTVTFAAGMLLVSVPLHAATIHVAGKCTLVNAIHAANLDRRAGACRAGRGNDTILLTKNVNLTRAIPTYDGPFGTPAIKSAITIRPKVIPAAGRPEISIARKSKALFRIFTVHYFGTLNLQRVKVVGGELGRNHAGGGILTDGSLRLMGVTVRGNKAAAGTGGFYAFSMTATHSSIEHNFGAGLVCWDFCQIYNSTIAGNTLHGVVTHGDGSVYLTHVTISGNHQIGILNTSVTYLVKSLISGNGREIHSFEGAQIIASNHNIFGHSSDMNSWGFEPGPTDIVPTQPLNGILDVRHGSGGGFTPTYNLVPGSLPSMP